MSYCGKCGTEISEDSLFCHECGSSVKHTDTPIDNIKLTSNPNNETIKSELEKIPMPKLSFCFLFGFLSLMLFVAFIFAIQTIFLLGLVCLILCFIFVCGTIFEISDYKLAKKDFQLYQQKKQKEQEEKTDREKIKAEEKHKNQMELARKQSELNRKRDEYSKQGIPSCHKCGSPSIATVNRGYSIVWGFIGSGKPRNVCQKCGHKWEPGR